MVAIDTCGGFLGNDAPACDDLPEKLLFGNNGDHWYETGFDRDLLCPDRVEDYGEDLPAWVCEV